MKFGGIDVLGKVSLTMKSIAAIGKNHLLYGFL